MTAFSITRFQAELADVDHVGNGIDDWRFGDSGAWTRWIATTFQILAAPSAPHRYPVAPRRGDDTLLACAYWTPLWHLLLFSFAWSDPGLGLQRWIDAGTPADDPRLALIRELWATDGQLDWFVGWLGSGMPSLPGPFADLTIATSDSSGLTLDRQWVDDQRANAQRSGIPNPLSGGSDPLHLSMHFDGPLTIDGATDARLLRTDQAARRAVLTMNTATGWYRTLHELGSELPDIGARSWHVDVYVQPVGWLGQFRRSLRTGRWFAGKHSVHMSGNE